MHAWKRAFLTAAAASMAAAIVLLFTFSSASAAGAGAVSSTQAFHNATDSFAASNPCTGVPATITETYNGVFHYTFLTSGQGAGTGWATGTMTGDFVLTPDDVSQPSYSGHFTTWFGDNNNLLNGTETAILAAHATGSDGSILRYHEVAHLSVSATGVTISFDKPSCG